MACPCHIYAIFGDHNAEHHNQAADDTLVFFDVDRECVINIQGVHRCFEAIWRLKMNFEKSELLGIWLYVAR